MFGDSHSTCLIKYISNTSSISVSLSPPVHPRPLESVPVPQILMITTITYLFFTLDLVVGGHIIPALKKLSSNHQVLEWGTSDTEPYTSVHEAMQQVHEN